MDAMKEIALERRRAEAVRNFFDCSEPRLLSEAEYFEILDVTSRQIGAKNRAETRERKLQANARFQKRAVQKVQQQLEPEEYLRSTIREGMLRRMCDAELKWRTPEEIDEVWKRERTAMIHDFVKLFHQTVPLKEFNQISQEVFSELVRMSEEQRKRALKQQVQTEEESEKLFESLKHYRLSEQETMACFQSQILRQTVLSKLTVSTKEILSLVNKEFEARGRSKTQRI